ncbi:MAG: DUF3108 domain-containing protein [Azoarcus sp.]|nr:DUF3108 domain-containing protein [Azoarcus sp.]
MGLPKTSFFVWVTCVVLALGVFPETARAAGGKGILGWPQSGEVEYRAFASNLKIKIKGQGNLLGSLGNLSNLSNLPVGKARYSWTHDREQYQMRFALETAGDLALLYRLGYEQQSQGTFDSKGLRPQRFDVTQQGKTPDSALFDWDGDAGARVSIRRGDIERHNIELMPGDQDMLSVWRQVSLIDKPTENMLVVGNKNAHRVRIKSLGNATLQLPAGRFATRHFSAVAEQGAYTIELWLAQERGMVPVRAILTGPGAETYTLEATAVRVPN